VVVNSYALTLEPLPHIKCYSRNYAITNCLPIIPPPPIAILQTMFYYRDHDVTLEYTPTTQPAVSMRRVTLELTLLFSTHVLP